MAEEFLMMVYGGVSSAILFESFPLKKKELCHSTTNHRRAIIIIYSCIIGFRSGREKGFKHSTKSKGKN